MNEALNGTAIARSDDVTGFAAQAGVSAVLPALLEATRRIFPAASEIRTYVEDDPEIRDDRHIVFDVALPDLVPEEARAAQDRWHEALFQHCPAKDAAIFRLGLR